MNTNTTDTMCFLNQKKTMCVLLKLLTGAVISTDWCYTATTDCMASARKCSIAVLNRKKCYFFNSQNNTNEFHFGSMFISKKKSKEK